MRASRTCCDPERENKISLQKFSAADAPRFISIWPYGREFRAREKPWHVSRRVVPRRRYATWRWLVWMQPATSLRKSRGRIRLGFNGCLLLPNVPDCVPSVLHLSCICVNFIVARQKLVRQTSISRKVKFKLCRQ